MGLVGFSRSCYYVMEVLIKAKNPLAAVSTPDGVNQGYWQYLMFADFNHNLIAAEGDVLNGGRRLRRYVAGLAIALSDFQHR